jgi:RNA polymerase sigma factor (sigma-70 family)
VNETSRSIEAVWKIEASRVIAGLVRVVRDVGLAEEMAQDALVSALEHWPREGIPANPGAWLMATAKNRAIDELRRRKRVDGKDEDVRHVFFDRGHSRGIEEAVDDDVGDDLLRLVFIACHPVLSPEARVALTLRMLGGLTTEEIARGFLVPEPTIAQRIVRAKRTLSEAFVPFELPHGEERAARLPSVLEVIYLVFNEGYAATSGDSWMRPALCEEAMRLGRVLEGLMPDESEIHGLAALMEIQGSRTRARSRANGEPVPLLEQDRGLWDRLLITHGLAALAKAEASGPLGPYGLQAAIAACHARAATADETDWPRIATLYAALAVRMPSPVVELNRAVAISMAEGPAAGLARVDALRGEPALAEYHLLPAVRGDLLAKLGRTAEAKAEFERAAALTRNATESAFLRGRAAALRSP